MPLYRSNRPIVDQRVLFQLLGADMNVTTDQLMRKVGSFTRWRVTAGLVTNASISLTTAVGGSYTATSKGGSQIIAAASAYSTLTTAAKCVGPTINNTDTLFTTDVWFALTTPQGAAATADVYLFGVPFS